MSDTFDVDKFLKMAACLPFATAQAGKPETQKAMREAERAYEAACVYVRCFCDQFKTSPQKAWESPGGIPQERADAEKHTP